MSQVLEERNARANDVRSMVDFSKTIEEFL